MLRKKTWKLEVAVKFVLFLWNVSLFIKWTWNGYDSTCLVKITEEIIVIIIMLCCYHVVPISLTLSRHFSLSFIASSRSSELHPVSSHSCCMYVRTGHPAFAQPYVRVHRSTSLMSLSLLLQQCPACLVHLTWIVFVMGGRWPYSWWLIGCCCQDLFNFAHNILV